MAYAEWTNARHCALTLIAGTERTAQHTVEHTSQLWPRHNLGSRTAGSTVGTPHYPLQVQLLLLELLLLPLGLRTVERRYVRSPQGSPVR